MHCARAQTSTPCSPLSLSLSLSLSFLFLLSILSSGDRLIESVIRHFVAISIGSGYMWMNVRGSLSLSLSLSLSYLDRQF